MLVIDCPCPVTFKHLCTLTGVITVVAPIEHLLPFQYCKRKCGGISSWIGLMGRWSVKCGGHVWPTEWTVALWMLLVTFRGWNEALVSKWESRQGRSFGRLFLPREFCSTDLFLPVCFLSNSSTASLQLPLPCLSQLYSLLLFTPFPSCLKYIHRRDSANLLISPHLTTMAGVGLGWSWESGTLSGSPMWAVGAQYLDHLLLPFHCTLIGNGLEVEAARTGTGIHMGCWHHRPLCHIAALFNPISEAQSCLLKRL